MDLPIELTSETEVILEDVARFRALSPEDRMQVIVDILKGGDRLMASSPEAAEKARQHHEEQKNLERQAIREFIARHGY